MNLKCIGCEKNFINQHRRSYCSIDCYQRSKKLQNSLITKKVCTSCKILKSKSEYYSDSRLAAGFGSECKKCLIERAKPKTAEAKEKIRARSRSYHLKNREKILKRNKENNKEIRTKVLNHYGNNDPKCICCKEDTQEFLTVDHIDNTGNEHRKSMHSKGENSHGGFYRWLIKNNFPDGYQLLCWNCNFGKYRYGQCPHLINKRKQDEQRTEWSNSS